MSRHKVHFYFFRDNTMKTILSTILFCLISSITFAGGASVTVGWDAPPVDEWGTKIYIGTTSGVYENSEGASIGATQHTIDNLQYNTPYFITATHYYKGEESEYAEEITWTSPPQPEITFNPLPEIINDVVSYHIDIKISH